MLYWLKLGLYGAAHPSKVTKTLRNLRRSRRAEAFIVSYPKTGRTWLRVMLGQFLATRVTHADDILLDSYAISERAGIKKTLFSHDGPFLLFSGGSYRDQVFHDERYRGRDVVFIVRDVRDTLVSSYFQESQRMHTYNGSISDFLRDDVFGVRRIVTFYNLWYQNRAVPRSFLLVRYEDMHADPRAVLAEVVETLGVENPSAEALQRAVDYASFDNMKRMESRGDFRDPMMQPGEAGSSESFKVRRGKIGGYADYLSPEDIAYVQEVVEEMALPGCDWYFAPGTAGT
jgi:Sulfotransferase domain